MLGDLCLCLDEYFENQDKFISGCTKSPEIDYRKKEKKKYVNYIFYFRNV